MLVLAGETLCDPEVAIAPAQAPVAVQAVALVDDHVSVLLPSATADALRLTVGAGTPAAGGVAVLLAPPQPATKRIAHSPGVILAPRLLAAPR